MVDQLYNWTRFWIPRGERFTVDGGFLSGCKSRIGRILNPNAVTLESVEPGLACLVLLGEPGIGKSKQIEKQKDLTETHANKMGDKTLSFDLGVYSTDTNLCHEIFENATIKDWLLAKYHLNLFLDSLG
jgi:hypothetical protein